MFERAYYLEYVVCILHRDLGFSVTVTTPTDVSCCALFLITLILNLCTVSASVGPSGRAV